MSRLSRLAGHSQEPHITTAVADASAWWRAAASAAESAAVLPVALRGWPPSGLSLGSHSGAACVSRFSNVCVALTGRGPTLRFDDDSRCNGAPCVEGPPRLPTHREGSSRSPIRWQQRRADLPALRSALAERAGAVALLPSGWWGEGSVSLGTSTNVAHQLYDSPRLELHTVGKPLLHELDVANLQNVSRVLGERFDAAGGPTLRLRQLLFASASFAPPAPPHAVGGERRHLRQRASRAHTAAAIGGCFERLYSYIWSCDRHMARYAASSAVNRPPRSLVRLRRLASALAWRSGGRAARPTRRTMILYGRTDTARRRLLNVSAHRAALQAHFEPRGWRVLLWDDVLREGASVGAQLRLALRASALVTPHGAVASVFGLLLPRGAVLLELFSACFTYSWLKPHVTGLLGIRHRRVAMEGARTLVDVRSGAPIAGCPGGARWREDPDLLVEPEALVREVIAGLEAPPQRLYSP